MHQFLRCELFYYEYERGRGLCVALALYNTMAVGYPYLWLLYLRSNYLSGYDNEMRSLRQLSLLYFSSTSW